MRRFVPVVLAGLLALALAAPAAAVKPARGCPNEGFVPMTREEFRQLSRDLGVPEEFLGEGFDAQWASYNKNGDAWLCVKDLPDNAGHLGSWVFNVIDNTSNK
jgi:hypothetical protein